MKSKIDNTKKSMRKRRALKVRSHIKLLGAIRLCVHRTSMHVYAQIINTAGDKVLASASSLDKDLAKDLKHGGNVMAAAAVGKAIAERAVKVGVTKVAFDRSGFHYHGRIKALADAAREAGLNF
jgi:large subunit ribosomal protein L18